MVKVLYLPIGHQPGTEEAFRDVGVNLSVFDFFTEGSRSKDAANRGFLARVREFQPDLIHMQLQMTDIITHSSLAEAKKLVPGVVMTNWTGDIRVKPCASFVNASKFVDYSLLSNVGQIEMYRAAGCHNARYWQIGYDPKRFFPKNYTSFKYDVSFAGSHYPRAFPDTPLRLAVVQVLRGKYGARFGLFGQGYPRTLKTDYAAPSDLNEVYNNSACVLSISHFNDVSHYFSDRLVMCLASGRPTIVYRFPGYDNYFGHLNSALIANTKDEIVSLVEFCKTNPEEATRIGNNGWLEINAKHSFASRVLELLAMTNLIGRL